MKIVDMSHVMNVHTGCPCRIVAFLDMSEDVEAVGNAAKAILES